MLPLPPLPPLSPTVVGVDNNGGAHGDRRARGPRRQRKGEVARGDELAVLGVRDNRVRVPATLSERVSEQVKGWLIHTLPGQ